MTKKKRYGMAIGATAACIAVLGAAGACNGTAKEERTAHRVIVTTATTTATTQPFESSTVSTSLTTATAMKTTDTTTTETQITTMMTCSATEQGLGETPNPTMPTEQTTEADTTVRLTTTAAPATTTAQTSAQPYNGQTSGDYIYCIGFGWIFNEGGGGEGSVNYEMYCNGNKIGYFGKR